MIVDEFIVIKKPNGISYKYYKDLGYDLSSVSGFGHNLDIV